MGRRSIVATSLATAVVIFHAFMVASCTSQTPVSDPDLPAGPNSLAYVTRQPAVASGTDILPRSLYTFGLIRDNQVIAKETNEKSQLTNPYSKPMWTLDGRYVATIMRAEDQTASSKLIAINAETGTSRTVDCERCTTIAPVGDSRIFISLDSTFGSSSNSEDPRSKLQVLKMDLASEAPPSLLRVGISSSSTYVALMPGTEGKSIVAAAEKPTGPQNLYSLSSDGSIQPFGNSKSSILLAGATPTAEKVNGRSMIAINGGWEKFVPNEGAGRIFLLDVEDGSRIDTDISALAPPDQLPSAGIRINVFDLWWGKDGNLYATVEVETGGFHSEEKPIVNIPPSLWRLDGNRWSQVNNDRVSAVRQFDKNKKAVVVPVRDDSAEGDLYLDTDGQRSRLLEHVLAMSSPS